MDTVYRVASSLLRILRSRLFSTSALAVVCAAIIAYVTLNMNAITVLEGDSSRVVITLDENSRRALSNEGAAIQENEDVPVLASQDDSEINPSCDVQITADGVSRIMSMSGGTVSDAIQKVGVIVGKFDKVNYDLTKEISDGMDIQVDRVAYEEYTQTQAIDYKTITKFTSTIVKGKPVIQQDGKEGVKTLTYRKCFENGKIIGTELVKEEITTAPVDQIKLIGTSTRLPISEAPFDIPLNASGQPLNYSAVYTGRATAYSSDHGNAGKYTASGRKAQVGVVAVNTNLIPYGTKLYIVSSDGSYVYGYAIAGDTGTACMRGDALVDLYYDTYEECCDFGAKKMNVYVIG